jgi:D-xylose transport system permease protein
MKDVPEQLPRVGSPPARRSGPPLAARLSDAMTLRTGAFALVAGLVVLAVVFNFLTDGQFLSARNVSLLFRQSAIVGVAGAGMVILMVSGGIDLSVGAAVYVVSAVASTLVVVHNWGVPEAIGVAVVIGLVLGAFQGYWVAFHGLPAFVVTLAGLTAFRGLGYLYTDAATVAPLPRSFTSISEGFIAPTASVVVIGGVLAVWLAVALRGRALRAREGVGGSSGTGRAFAGQLVLAGVIALAVGWVALSYRGLPWAVVIMAATLLVLTFLTSQTRFGRALYAIGGNREAARLAGINIGRTILFSFCVMGLVYGIAGVLLAARLSGAPPAAGTGLELDAIAAAVIGGTSLAGGIGKVPRALLGALWLTSIDNGMSLLNVSSFTQMVIKGGVLLGAIWLDVKSRQRAAA